MSHAFGVAAREARVATAQMLLKRRSPQRRQLVNSTVVLVRLNIPIDPRLEHLPTGPDFSACGPEASNFIRLISSSRGCRTFPEIFISQPYRQIEVLELGLFQPPKMTLRKRTLATAK